ncbi:Lrp/AsnC family transcriptional regulator [Candidatus Woesearchaeota archaeon]|nr:Lrp/AsnC family transcriptional regulator [Candidatus Woesearchaeota archaeon]
MTILVKKMLPNKFIGQIKEYRYSSEKEIKLDLIDRKILYLIEINARFSPTAISKILLISRETISYRIKKMEELNLLHGYVTLFDHKKLGFNNYRIYLKFKNIFNDKEIIEELFKLSEITTIVTCSGSYDLQFVISVKTQDEFLKTFDSIIGKYSQSIERFKVLEIFQEGIVSRWMILCEDEAKKIRVIKEHKGSTFQKEFHRASSYSTPISLDEKDRKILEILKLDAKASISALSNKLSLSPLSIENRIKKMILAGIIKSFFPQSSLTQLGYQWWHVLLKMKNLDEKKFFTFIEHHPNTSWYMKFLGEWDYQCSIYAKTNADFHDILEQIRHEFADNIMYYDSFIMFNQLKYSQRVL